MSPAAENVLERLDATRQRWWLFTLLSTAVLAFSLSFGTLLLFALGDVVLRFPQGVLVLAFAMWLSTTVVAVALMGRRMARSQRSLEATARRVELELPELGNDLINLVQLADDTRQAERGFCEAAIREAALRVAGVRFEEASRRESRAGRFLHCMQTPRDLAESALLLAILFAIALVCQATFPHWGSALGRVLKPFGFVPSVGAVGNITVSPEDTEVLVGSSLEITGSIEGTDGKVYDATLWIAAEGEAETSTSMAADEGGTRYRATIPSVVRPASYRLEIGDSQTRRYAVQVREKPTIAEVEVTLRYPAYLNRPAETVTQKDADLEAPQYTVAELTVRPSAPIASGQVLIDGQKFVGRVADDGQAFQATIPLLRDGTFILQLTDSAGLSDPNPRLNRVHVLPDALPTVELLKPARQETVRAGASVPILVRAGDDHGLGQVRLEMKVRRAGPDAEGEPAAEPRGETAAKADPQGGKVSDAAAEPEEIVVLHRWTQFDADTATLHHRLDLPAERFKPGQQVLVRAVALDNRDYREWGLTLGPQETASGWHALRIVSPDAQATSALAEIESLREVLGKLLEKQVRARVAAGAILEPRDVGSRADAAGQVRTQQVEIQKAATAAVESIRDTHSDERRVIQRVLHQLALGEMLQAVARCDALVKQKALEGFDGPAAELRGIQDRIIEVLRKLLGAARQAQNATLAEMEKRPGADLPEDVRKKLEEAKKKLEEFLKQQKKVIEGSENLAKKSAEDFSEEEGQLLAKLAAVEDDWSKFLQDLHTDLSKLPEQDFANASVAKELVEIQTEIKMAADALTKKSVDIAVPLEQLGYERAEEMTTNLEKWLPDSPDREKWSQEESLSDADKEAPMAELPGELEDLIGDLMEEEEDLFEEMEDVTSSAADSLDKGAGWDAVDGPISNMSARGVTGNRLPNTSEIGGRAGEGRQGKSSGEFVGDEAVGKGGRRTPTRLTPDPIMKGQIKDHSKDPTGGATGGGKESGQGGEGLEGPAPKSPGPRDVQRLAGRQAALRNKAEGIDSQFQIANFHHTDLKKMIEMMRQVEADLKAGNYQNALRQREVLADKMGNVKQYLEGEFEIRKDTTTNLPGEIQKELLGGMQEASPAGWEELNRQYFQRLSAGGAAEKEPAKR